MLKCQQKGTKALKAKTNASDIFSVGICILENFSLLWNLFPHPLPQAKANILLEEWFELRKQCSFPAFMLIHDHFGLNLISNLWFDLKQGLSTEKIIDPGVGTLGMSKQCNYSEIMIIHLTKIMSLRSLKTGISKYELFSFGAARVGNWSWGAVGAIERPLGVGGKGWHSIN